MKTDFQIFNEKFFGKLSEQIAWYDKKGVIQLGNNKIAEIIISINGVSGEYSCYVVNIVNKNSGLISSHTFKFNDYLKTRIDSRTDIKNQKFCIIDHCGINWYIAIPKTSEIKNMADTIANFIKEYQ